MSAENDDGIVGVGGNLDVDTLLRAYEHGVFPWPVPRIKELVWFSPPLRGVLFLDELKTSRSFTRFLEREPHAVSFNLAFDEVIRECAVHHRAQGGTWIRSDMVAGFTAFHRAGYAHSVEIWDAAGNLQGGMYGVALHGYFAGESMFYRQPNASKAALFHVAQYLKSRGVRWMDIQVLNPFTASLGAREISRDVFYQLLRESLQQKIVLFPRATSDEGSS